ncbi:hypothetical protein ACSQ67_024395 [Phaseolus vulgaris]
MGTNFESCFNLCQLAHPLLKASGCGNIVFISSVAGLKAFPICSAYAASKGALNQFTKNVALEWAKDNIRANAVAPGPVKTDLLDSLMECADVNKNVVEAVVSESPIGCFPLPSSCFIHHWANHNSGWGFHYLIFLQPK